MPKKKQFDIFDPSLVYQTFIGTSFHDRNATSIGAALISNLKQIWTTEADMENLNFPHFLQDRQGAEKCSSRKEQAYECLRNWIIYSQLKPGTPLNERELADKFGLSRTPLREMLQRLSFQQLIIIKPRKGIFVAPIDYVNLRSIFEVRAPVEAKAAFLAARRATDGDIAALQKIVDRSYDAHKKSDCLKLIQHDQVFHEMLGRISRNPVLSKVMEDLHNVCLRFWYLSTEFNNDSYQSVDDLDGIVEAIRKREPELAAARNETHVMSFLQYL